MRFLPVKHPSMEKLKAHLDGEGDAPESAELRIHLEACAACRDTLVEMQRSSLRIRASLDAISPQPFGTLTPAHQAHTRLHARLSRKEQKTMLNRSLPNRYRAAWIISTLVLILAVSFSFPQVRAIASSFLGLFRVKQVTVVQIDPANISTQMGSSAQLEALFAEDVQVERSGETMIVEDAGEASSLAGISVRLPELAQGKPRLEVTPATKMTFSINLSRVLAILGELGHPDVDIPPGLDGETIMVDLPPAVAAIYGKCRSTDPDGGDFGTGYGCTTLLQMTSPVVSAPPGLDIAKIGETFLQLLGMTPEEAARFSQNIDWATTLVVPIPQNSTSYREVPVDGATGTLITQNLPDHPAHYLLMWVKDDVVYALSGPGSATTAINLASTLK